MSVLRGGESRRELSDSDFSPHPQAIAGRLKGRERAALLGPADSFSLGIAKSNHFHIEYQGRLLTRLLSLSSPGNSSDNSNIKHGRNISTVVSSHPDR